MSRSNGFTAKPASIRFSVALSYSAQTYSAVISIALLPLFIDQIGAEGFGLIGFYLMLQGWLQVLDAGIGNSLARETSVTSRSGVLFRQFLRQVRYVLTLFFVVAALLLLAGFTLRESIATNWIDSTLDPELLASCIAAMFYTLAARYLIGPGRSILIGLERHGTINLFLFLFASLRYPGAIAVLWWTNGSLAGFFIYQALVATLELILTYAFSAVFVKSALTGAADGDSVANEGEHTLGKLLAFSMQLSALSILWVIVTQIDKLVLSHKLSLTDFGYFTFAVSAASLLTLLYAPLSTVLMPRLSLLASSGKKQDFATLYGKSLQQLSLLLSVLATFLAFFSAPLIQVWSGNTALAQASGEYVAWLAAGNALAGLMNHAFILQYALGRLRAHLICYAVYAAILVPLTIVVCNLYGANGAVRLWFAHNLVFFVVWGGVVNARLLRGAIRYVYLQALPVAVCVSALCFALAHRYLELGPDRMKTLVSLAGVGVSTLLICTAVFYLTNRNQARRQETFALAG